VITAAYFLLLPSVVGVVAAATKLAAVWMKTPPAVSHSDVLVRVRGVFGRIS
jgi:hypothetical protein